MHNTGFLLLGLCITAGTAALSMAQSKPAPAAAKTESRLVLASASGAALNSDLMKGGGTDDTAALQRVLDRAKNGRGVHFVIDGPALVSGLDVYSHTTIECTSGAGLYLKDDANRAILRNAHRSKDAVTDEHITVRGCFLHGNRKGQRLGAPLRSSGHYDSYEPDGKTFQSGLQFFGVHHLTLENLILWNIRSFAVWIANVKYVHLSDITVDTGLPPYPTEGSLQEQRAYKVSGANDDGVHVNGPAQYVTMNGLKLRTLDDALALNANVDTGPYVGEGAITDVAISNVVFMDAHQGIRLLSRDQRIDRIVMQNLSGTVRQRVVLLSHFLRDQHTGNFGSIVFSNVAIDPVKSPSYLELYPTFKSITPDKWDIAEEAERPLFSLNSPIENLTLRGIVTQTIDSRPVIRVGPYASVQSLNVDLSLHDPKVQAVPLKLMGRIERLNFSLDWHGNTPIQYEGGNVQQLRWGSESFWDLKR